MNCPNCAKQISDTAKVCGYCGTRLTQPEPPPAPSEIAAPPVVDKPVPEPAAARPVIEPQPEPALQPVEAPMVEEAPQIQPQSPQSPHEPAAATEEMPPPEVVEQNTAARQAAPEAENRRKRLPGWIWAVVGLLVVAALAVVYIVSRPDQAQPETAAARPTAALEKPDPTSAPIEKEEENQLLRQYADDWYGADLLHEYEFDDFAFFEAQNNVEELVYSANYEEGDGYIRLIGTGSWDTFFCEHHYQPGYGSITVFSLEEDSNFMMGNQTSNYSEEDYFWWGFGGPEGEAGTIRVDETDNIHFLADLEPETLYWLMLANEGSDFLIRLGEVEKDIVLDEAILYMESDWDLPEWRYCVNVGDGVVDLHYYVVRSHID